MSEKISKNRLQKLGRNLRDSTNPAEDDINLLQQYRLSHKDIVKAVFDIVCRESMRINSDAICSFRIKRIDSIIRKLRRLKGYVELKSMRDIAGCRCILNSDAEVFKLMKALKNTELQLVQDINVYIGSKKKKTGYQSIHMYVSLSNYDNKCVEIQIRSVAHHDWATFVEMMDLIYNTKIKEGTIRENSDIDNDFYKFHQLLAANDRAKNDDAFIIQTIVKYDIIGKIDEILVKNIVNVRRQWVDIMSSTNDAKYFFITTDIKNQAQIKAFNTYSEAESHYYSTFEANPNNNMVLVSMPNVTFDAISVAYSNYVLACHKFTHTLHSLFANYVKKYYLDESYVIMNFITYYRQRATTITRYISIEVKYIKSLAPTCNRQIIEEWFLDVQRRLNDFKDDVNILNNVAVRQLIIGDTKGLVKIFRLIIYYINLLWRWLKHAS